MDAVETLILDAPAFHGRGDRSYGLHPDALRFLASHTGPDTCTLETGAGLSTVVFALRGGRHACVAPAAGEFARIRAYCDARGIRHDGVRWIDRRSEECLPTLDIPPLDLVLIDGGHGFPIPFVDWLYAGRKLKAGGWLLVDDTHLWTGRMLRQFLRESPEWECHRELGLRTAVFRRVAGRADVGEWCEQPFILRRQRWLNAIHDLRQIGLYIRHRQFRQIVRSVRRRLRRNPPSSNGREGGLRLS